MWVDFPVDFFTGERLESCKGEAVEGDIKCCGGGGVMAAGWPCRPGEGEGVEGELPLMLSGDLALLPRPTGESLPCLLGGVLLLLLGERDAYLLPLLGDGDVCLLFFGDGENCS